jgi:hypothetical protein
LAANRSQDVMVPVWYEGQEELIHKQSQT